MVDAGGPMTERDFDAELRAEEAARHAAGIPPAVLRSVWARLEAGHHGDRRRRPAGAIAGVVALTAVAVGIVATLVALRPAARLGDLVVARRSDDLSAGVDAGVVAIERGAAILIDPPSGLTIATAGQVSLRREARGVRLLRGHIDVTAAHRPPGAAPSAILVSHGAIEVMGTAFTVVQEPAGGRVTLREGSIRFQAADGREVSLLPGEALAWPLPPPAPSPPPPQPSRMPRSTLAPAARAAAATPPPPAADLTLLDRIDELRSRRQFEPAARALRRAIPLQPEPMRERLSFELGSLLTHQIGDVRRACAQWARHDRHYPEGRYRDEVARSRRALRCPAPSGAP
jgi:transmembrane sensor